METLGEQRSGVVSIHSTLCPGTAGGLAAEQDIKDYAVTPEFLFSDTAEEDAVESDQLLVGANTDAAYRTVRRAFEPGRADILRTTPEQAALVKLVSNAYAATKISFANQMWRLATTLSADHGHDIDPDETLAHFRTMSPWVGRPGRGLEGGWPYGGHCLPKDTRALRSVADYNDVQLHQLEGTIRENELFE
jgi:UDPglucose 6-dehydrogenase